MVVIFFELIFAEIVGWELEFKPGFLTEVKIRRSKYIRCDRRF